MKKGLIIAALIIFTISGCQRQKEVFGGVPVQGTIWEFAAALAEKGDGSFVPECVNRVNIDGAIIEGTFEDYESDNRPFLWCTIEDDQVVKVEIRTNLEEE